MLALFVAGMTLYVYGYEHRGDADYAREEGLGEGSCWRPRRLST